jgi:uncharacterized membrane protein
MYETLRAIHLIAVIPCIFLGGYLIFLSTKGNHNHKFVGKIYMSLMAIQALISLFMKAHVGNQFLDHFGWIHIISIITLISIPQSLYLIRKNNIKGHQYSMVILYFSGLIIAGAFTLMPGRYLNEVLFH